MDIFTCLYICDIVCACYPWMSNRVFLDEMLKVKTFLVLHHMIRNSYNNVGLIFILCLEIKFKMNTYSHYTQQQ